jgi:serine/threonine-protein kinase
LLDPAAPPLDDKYEIFEVLGRGGMGCVYRARHRQLDRWVAIKLLSRDLGDPDDVTRFCREARAAAQISSVHVAQVMDAGILANGRPYIVMEYLRGNDLSRLRVQHGRLSVSVAVDYVLQAIEGLAEAHALQIVHRDVKPHNLFVTTNSVGDRVIKVLDFGVAKGGTALDGSGAGVTARGAVLGTPSYMAPEQFEDAQSVDARADIWACGATLFELLCGQVAFRGKNFPEVYRSVVLGTTPSARALAPEVPEGLDAVIARCLARDRCQRYADACELARALLPWTDAAGRERVERIARIASARSRATECTAVTASFDDIASVVVRSVHESKPRFDRRRGFFWTTFAASSLLIGWALWSVGGGRNAQAASQPWNVSAPSTPQPANASLHPQPAGTSVAAATSALSDAPPAAGLGTAQVEPREVAAAAPIDKPKPRAKPTRRAPAVAAQVGAAVEKPKDTSNLYERYP